MIDPYFSATKVKWILQNIKISKNLLKSKNLLFGTIDTFLIWKLTNEHNHLTETTNAIQANDFMFRKTLRDNGKTAKEFLQEIKVDCEQNQSIRYLNYEYLLIEMPWHL